MIEKKIEILDEIPKIQLYFAIQDQEATFQMLNIDRIYNVRKSMPFIDVEGSVEGLAKYFIMERRFTRGSFDLVVFMVG